MIFVTKNKSVHFAEGKQQQFIRRINLNKPENLKQLHFIVNGLAGYPISIEDLERRVSSLAKVNDNPTEVKINPKQHPDPRYQVLGKNGLSIRNVPGTTELEIASDYRYMPKDNKTKNLHMQKGISPTVDSSLIQSLAEMFIDEDKRGKFKINLNNVDHEKGNSIEFITEGGSLPGTTGKFQMFWENPSKIRVNDEIGHITEVSKADTNNPVSKDLIPDPKDLIPVSKGLGSSKVFTASNRYFHNNRFYPVNFADDKKQFERELDLSDPENVEQLHFIVNDLYGYPIDSKDLKEKISSLKNVNDSTGKKVLNPKQHPKFPVLGKSGLSVSHIPGTTKLKLAADYRFHPKADKKTGRTANQIKELYMQKGITPEFDSSFIHGLAESFIPEDKRNLIKVNLNSGKIDPKNGNLLKFNLTGGSLPDTPGKLEALITNPSMNSVNDEKVHILELSNAKPNIPVSKELVTASNRYFHNNRFYPVNFGGVPKEVVLTNVEDLPNVTEETPSIDAAEKSSENLKKKMDKYRKIDTTISLGSKSMLAGGLIGGIGGGLIGGISAPMLDTDKKRSKLKKILRGMIIGGATGSILGGLTGGAIGTSTGIILSPGAASFLDNTISVEGSNGLKNFQKQFKF